MKIQVLLVVLWLSELYCDESWSYENNSSQYVLTEKFFWGHLDFKFPNASARNIAISSASYIPENNNIWSMGVWRNKVFVSVFRFLGGVASSLNYFALNSQTKSPVLIPYPSFDANYVSEDPRSRTTSLPSNSSIISAAYFRIDKCDRLWVLDTGVIELFGSTGILAPPALVIFDLKTNQLLKRYVIPAAYVTSNSIFANLDIDFDGNSCDDAYAYIVDMFRSIVVYSLKKDRSWRLTHSLFGSDPRSVIFHYEGRNIEWNYGIFGITIGERLRDGSRRVYINPFASTRSYYISNQILQNEQYVTLNDYYYDVHLLGDRGYHGQIYTWAYDGKTNVLCDTQFYRNRITCWNTADPYRNSSFAVVYKSKPSFFTDVSIDRKRNLWVVDNNLPIFVYGSWNANAKNIRILSAKIDDVISGTVCTRNEPRPKPHRHSTLVE